MTETRQQAERARKAFLKLSAVADRTGILKEVSVALKQNATYIFDANAKDLAEARGKIAEPLYKRLVLNESKLRDVIAGIEQISEMEDPVGRELKESQLDKGLTLRKVKTPIGILAA